MEGSIMIPSTLWGRAICCVPIQDQKSKKSNYSENQRFSIKFFFFSFGAQECNFRAGRPDFVQNEPVKIDFHRFVHKNMKFHKY